MSNVILKAGDLVKYKTPHDYITGLGFVLGQFYTVVQDWTGHLILKIGDEELVLIERDEDDYRLTDNTDYFTKHVCPVVLPRGLAG